MKIKAIVFDHDGTLIDTLRSKKIFVGIEDLVKELSENFELFVWTARNRFSTLEYLKKNQILPFFEDISTSTDHQIKPHIEGLEYMLGHFQPQEVCVIGDSTTDMIGAKNFMAYALGANWQDRSNTKVQELKKAGADFVCQSPSEVMGFIEQLTE